MQESVNELRGERDCETPLRVALIGLGGVAESHLAAYVECSDIVVVAGVDPRESRLHEMSSRFGFRAYPDHMTMLRSEKLDIACVLTPARLHREIAEDCATARVHVLCEKPMALTLEDAESMVTACAEQDVKFCYGSSYRYLPAVRTARDMVRQGAVGDVVLMTESVLGGSGLEAYQPMGADHYPKGGPGGSSMGLVDHGIHLIDVFPWIAGARIASVYGKGNVTGAAPDTECVQMTFDNGSMALLLYNEFTYSSALPTEGIFSVGDAWNVDGPAPANTWHQCPTSMQLYGTRGTLRVFPYGNLLFLRNEDGLRQIPVSEPAAPAHFATQIERFVQSIRENEPSPVQGDVGVEALRALFAVYESQRTGKVVSL